MLDFAHMQKDSIALGGFRVILSTKADGNMSALYGDGDEVSARRDAFCRAHGVNPSDIVFIEPRHTGSLALVSREEGGATGGAVAFEYDPFMKASAIDADFSDYIDAVDGLLTVDPTIAVALLSGDCVPLVLADEETGLHGILHVGLLGLLNDITGTLGDALTAMLVPIWRVKFYMGPHISAMQYDLSKSGMWERVGKQALEKCPWIADFIDHRTGGAFLDLAAALDSRLALIDVKPESIVRDSRGTAEIGSEFLSHFKSKRENVPNGRFMTLVGR